MVGANILREAYRMKHDPITIYTAANQPVHMRDLWHDQSALLFFLRNPGCAICRQQLFGLKQRAGEFAARGIALAAVTQANPTVTTSTGSAMSSISSASP